MRAPVGDGAGHPDIGDYRQGGGTDQIPTEIVPENPGDNQQLQNGRGDVEQHEIEHRIDALGAALDHFGYFAGTPREVEPH